jgi:hypothetical protein
MRATILILLWIAVPLNPAGRLSLGHPRADFGRLRGRTTEEPEAALMGRRGFRRRRTKYAGQKTPRRARTQSTCGIQAADAPKIVYKKSEEHKFSALKLRGQLKKPDLSYIYKRKGLRAEQIVNIPENFNQEIREGADQF